MRINYTFFSLFAIAFADVFKENKRARLSQFATINRPRVSR